MNTIVKATKEMESVYNKINGLKIKYGIFHKCVFHMHSPASYDYKLLNCYSAEDYQKCSASDVYNLCVENRVFPADLFSVDYFGDKDQFGEFDNAKECLSYLLMAQKIIDMKIEMIVLTDHNTISGYNKLVCAIKKLKKAKTAGVYPEVILGVELSCADRNHVVGIFEGTAEDNETVERWLKEYILSEKEGTYLTSINVLRDIAQMGGLGYIAHIDNSNTFHNDYLNGAYKKKLFELECNRMIGVSNHEKKEIVKNCLKAFTKKEFCFFVDEDAHCIDEIGSQCMWIKGSKLNFSMIKDAIRDYEISINYEEPHELNNYIRGLYIDGDGNNFLSGKENNEFCLSFSDALNCIIGGRGTGKSSILQILEFVIRQHCPNKETLEFICNHKNVWVLVKYNDDEFMIHFSAPVKEYKDDQILKYFTDDRYHRYGYKYYFHEYDVEEYALKNYIEIRKLFFRNGQLFCEIIRDKKKYLQKFFNIKYSVNELVKTASGDEINSFIYNTLFQNVTIDNAAHVINARSRSGLKRVVLKMDSLIADRKKSVHNVIDEFNEREAGVLRIVYKMDGRMMYFDFEKIINENHFGYYFHRYNILTESVSDYFYRLQETIGIVQLLKLSFEKKYEEINKSVPISDMLSDMTNRMVENGVHQIQKEEEINLIEEIMDELLNEKNVSEIITYLQSYITEMETFDLEFNLNSKETNQKATPLYKNVKLLSLGQKVVAMLSFVLGYSDYSNDFTPFIVDQPEDNLDNQYIYKNLVKQLRDIKLKRQVIIATHNATIVTNARADQIILMESDYRKGWVETTGYPNETRIKKHIINYLEGGIDSFRHKCATYDEIING